MNLIGASQSPSTESQAFSSSSTTTPEKATRGVYIGTDGNLAVEMVKDGETRTFNNVKAGTVLPLAVVEVKSATTASGVLLF